MAGLPVMVGTGVGEKTPAVPVTGAEGALCPWALLAITTKVYDWPAVRLLTTQEVGVAELGVVVQLSPAVSVTR